MAQKNRNKIMIGFASVLIVILLFFLTACSSQNSEANSKLSGLTQLHTNDSSNSQANSLIENKYVPQTPKGNQTRLNDSLTLDEIRALKPSNLNKLVVPKSNQSYYVRRVDPTNCSGVAGPPVCDSTNITLPNSCYARARNTTVLYEGSCK